MKKSKEIKKITITSAVETVWSAETREFSFKLPDGREIEMRVTDDTKMDVSFYYHIKGNEKMGWVETYNCEDEELKKVLDALHFYAYDENYWVKKGKKIDISDESFS
ncbi:MAG: hypothetical protein WC119_07530 [Synergistaceae bacterium]